MHTDRLTDTHKGRYILIYTQINIFIYRAGCKQYVVCMKAIFILPLAFTLINDTEANLGLRHPTPLPLENKSGKFPRTVTMSAKQSGGDFTLIPYVKN